MKGKLFRRIGRLTKLHGFEGEAILIADDFFPKKIDKTEWVFMKIDGLPVPFFVSKIHLRSESAANIKLLDISSSIDMQKFLGNEIYIEETSKQKSSRVIVSKNDIKNYTIIDSKEGNIGIAETIINLNGNYLLQLFKNDREILIPVSDEFILEIDDKQKVIFVSVPKGLLDLNL